MEGITFRLMISLVLMAAVVAIAFYEINTYIQLNTRKNFADDVIELRQAMKTLVYTSDYGSFDRIRIMVPEGANITVDNETDKIYVNFFGENQTYNASGDILWYRNFNPGMYDLELYYGEPGFPPERDNYTIAFK